MKGLGFVLFIIGIAAADTNQLLLPSVLVAVGLILLMKGRSSNEQ